MHIEVFQNSLGSVGWLRCGSGHKKKTLAAITNMLKAALMF